MSSDNYIGPERRSSKTWYGRRKEDYAPIHPWRWRFLSAWIIIFTVVVMLSLVQIRHARSENCTRVSQVIHDILAASDASLGKPGTPGYAYYKNHPNELRQAHAANRKLLAQTDPRACTS